MAYIRRVPSPPLASFIHDLYYLDSPAHRPRLKTFPMPVTHLMVNLGEPFYVREAEHAEPFAAGATSWLVGPWSRYHIVDWPHHAQFFGVHFKPAGACPFFGPPLSEMHNQVVSLDALWGRAASEIREQLYHAPGIQARLALLERFLLARFTETPPGLDIVQYAIGQIARHAGALSIRALSDQIGISQNHLGTQFKRVVGLTPKQLARSYRFAQVLRFIDLSQPVDWTEIAHRFHFYDQSHFNKDFAAFTGLSPTEYLQARRRMHVQPENSQNLGQMPID